MVRGLDITKTKIGTIFFRT